VKATLVFLICLCPALPAFAELDSKALEKAADGVLAPTLKEYEWFHRNPELSLQEKKTAARLADGFKKLGLDVTTGVGGHGVVGILKSDKNAAKRVVLYRTDLDGLPVTEATGLPYASENKGVMHACGHDIHMATALGAMSILAASKDQWEGTVIVIGQPAEELGMGARMMLADPKFKSILKKVGKPAVALALHDWSEIATGQIGMTPGFAYANVDTVDIVVHGKGGHGAQPQKAIDPILIGAEIVMSLQSIVSRRISGLEPGVITVGRFAGGTKSNIIPDRAEMSLTVRSYKAETRKLLLDEIRRVAENVARAHNAPRAPEVTVSKDDYTMASYNDPEWTQKLHTAFEGLLGKDNVLDVEPTMGGEDFGAFSKTLGIPGVMWRLGAVPRNKVGKPDLAPPHSPGWAPEAKPALRIGILSATRAILVALGS
jgi:hippurate hydrolase